jgi:nucleoside-diphosphate-sugar epimerase/predicted dehydrogenase
MPDTRVGLIGAGYIASWHADALRATPGVAVTAVCDARAGAAQALADTLGARAFGTVDSLIAAGACDAVHILTPPDSHEEIALKCLGSGLHSLVEKPVAESVAAAQRMEHAAQAAGVRFHAGHNFLGLPSYERMKAAMGRGDYGRVSAADITWALPLAPLRSGPYTLWLLREPRNLLLELGPHLVAFANDLFGPLTILHAEASNPVAMPGGDTRPQGFRLLARAGGVDITVSISMVEVVDDRSVTLRGSSARARLDYAQDVLIVERENASDLVVNPLRRQLDLSRQHMREGLRNAVAQARSLNTKNPYGLSFRGMTASIYGALARGGPADPRFSGASAVAVMQALGDALTRLPADTLATAPPAVQTRAPRPSALVIGGTGFIGRALTRRLVADGRDVRVLSRGQSGAFPDLPDRVETVGVSLQDRDALARAMRGVDVVFNLAKSLDTTWEDALRNDVGVAVSVAEACLEAGVKRLVYTGTIASYDMSDPKRRITEATGFAPDMSDRNLYARSKAECENRLLQMHRARGLPVVIARPGIVVGPGGPLQHWGIGRWHGAGAVRIWGPGYNTLPFVLIDDVADGLVRMIDAPVSGESFNLVGEPMMSARDYFDAIHDRLGARIRVSGGNLHGFYAADAIKYVLKKHALRRQGVVRPSLADWKSRAHFSPFVNDKPKTVLAWRPETDRAAFIEKAIGAADLLGLEDPSDRANS